MKTSPTKHLGQSIEMAILFVIVTLGILVVTSLQLG